MQSKIEFIVKKMGVHDPPKIHISLFVSILCVFQFCFVWHIKILTLLYNNVTFRSNSMLFLLSCWPSSILDTSEAEVGVYVMLNGKTKQITHQSGTIISHREFPHQKEYPIYMDSQLKIQVAGVLFFSMEVNQFNLEKRYSRGCDDYLQINDNTGNRQYCGKEIRIGKSSRVVPNGQISFLFKTDGRTQNSGFRFQFRYFGKIILLLYYFHCYDWEKFHISVIIPSKDYRTRNIYNQPRLTSKKWKVLCYVETIDNLEKPNI